ncbi:biopolymer transporter ExbD [candidate division KSB1 bacterium]|nr:biopolymer transporter ExbD [candidate division KSB1 bacterium]
MRNRRVKIAPDINVTSLVDVTMVLLIVFIISAPFMRSGVRVDLPKAEARESQPQRAIIIAVDRNGQLFLNQEKVTMENLAAKITQLRDRAPNLPILIEGDAAVAYGQVIKIMDAVRRAGSENVGLVLEPEVKP